MQIRRSGDSGAAGRVHQKHGRPRVLVVEDNVALGKLMADALATDGIDTSVAGSPAHALVLCAEAGPFAVVLLDWWLGQSTGRDFAMAYRLMVGPAAPIVVVTGEDDVVAAAVEIGAAGFLRKPFDLDELSDMVGRFAKGHSAASLAAPATTN